MRDFNFYLQISGQNKIIWTSNDNLHLQYSTFEEKLEEAENNQYTLTFSIIAKSYVNNNVEYNPFLTYYYIGSNLQLILDQSLYINFVIKNIEPSKWVL